MDLLAMLRPHHGALLALLVALGAALAARGARLPLLGAVAAGLGILAGWWWVFGVLTASPRQLPERLPALMLVLVLGVPLLGLAVRRRGGLVLPALLLGALWTAWWMAGAPRTPADLRLAAPVLLAVSAATLLLARRGTPRWAGPVAGAALLAGLAGAALPGPQTILAGAAFAAALGATLVPPRGAADPLAALPLAAALAALAAVQVLARGAPADWTAAAAPFAALWLGPLLPGRLGGVAGAVLAGGACAAGAFLLR